MNLGVDQSLAFALGSLIFAGVNDLVFKKQAISGQGRGQYLAIVGGIWMLAFAGLAAALGQVTITPAAVKWGLVAGSFSIAGNYLLVASLRHLDASIGAAIYRLNLVLAALMAIFFLDEQLTWSKVAGLSLASLAVILFAERRSDLRDPGRQIQALILAVAASFLRAGMGISYKLAALEFARLSSRDIGPQQHWFLAIQGLVWLVVGLGISIRFEGVIKVNRTNLYYGVFSGLLCCGIVLFLAQALALGHASVVIPITQMSFLITALLSWPLVRERFSPRKLVALALAVMSVLFLARSP